MTSGEHVATVTPLPLAMVVCDFIYRDPSTGKFTLIGTFSTISGSTFPLKHPHFCVYAALSGGRGTVPLRMELWHEEDEKPLQEIRNQIACGDDPRAVQEVAFGFGGFEFPKPGEYTLSLYANDEFLIERRILARIQQQT